MTAVASDARRLGDGPARALVAVGTAALLARPWAGELASDPTTVLVVLFVALGAVGAWWPLSTVARPAPLSVAVVVTILGVAAFGAGRLLAGGRAAAPALAMYVVLNTLAAVAEEAFFRRLLFGVLERHGQAVAVVGSAAAFAAVHLTVWGVWALPLDLAAGLLLSWQRAVTGRWSVPALTHAMANVLAVV